MSQKPLFRVEAGPRTGGDPLPGVPGAYIVVDPVARQLLVHGLGHDPPTPDETVRILALLDARPHWRHYLGAVPTTSFTVPVARALRTVGLTRLGEYAQYLTGCRPVRHVLEVAYALAEVAKLPPTLVRREVDWRADFPGLDASTLSAPLPVSGAAAADDEPYYALVGPAAGVALAVVGAAPRRRWLEWVSPMENIAAAFVWMPGFPARLAMAHPAVGRLVATGFGGGTAEDSERDRHFTTALALALCGIVFEDAPLSLTETSDAELEASFARAARYIDQRTPPVLVVK